MYKNRILAADIVDMFDSFLESKNVEIPCADLDEEAERHKDDNSACLYGIEYWDLVNRVEFMIDTYYEREGVK